MKVSRHLIDEMRKEANELHNEILTVEDVSARDEMLNNFTRRYESRIDNALRVADLFDEHGFGLELVNSSGDRWAVVLMDPSEQGRYRYQEMDRRGFLGHRAFDTIEEALIEVSSSGYAIHDMGAMNRLASTQEWADGMAVNAIVQQMNSQMISWEEGRKKLDALAEERRMREEQEAAIQEQYVNPAKKQVSIIAEQIDKNQKNLNGLFDEYCKDHTHLDAKDRIESRILARAQQLDELTMLLSIYQTHEEMGIDASFLRDNGEMRARLTESSNNMYDVQYFNPGGIQWVVATPSYEDAAGILLDNGYFIHDHGAFDRYAALYEMNRSHFLDVTQENVDNGNISKRAAIDSIAAYNRKNPGFDQKHGQVMLSTIPSSFVLKNKIESVESVLKHDSEKATMKAPSMK